MKYVYDTWIRNSRRRGKPNDVTLEQFRELCVPTDYINTRGRTKTSMTLDRDNNDLGYTMDNIRVISNSENSRKKNKKLVYDWRTKTAVYVDVSTTVTDGPF